jgi:hypothetical protein
MYIVIERVKQMHDSIAISKEMLVDLENYLLSFININRYKRQEHRVDGVTDISYYDKFDARDATYTFELYEEFFSIKFNNRIEVSSTIAQPSSLQRSRVSPGRYVKYKKVSLKKEYEFNELSKAKKDIKKYFDKLKLNQ